VVRRATTGTTVTPEWTGPNTRLTLFPSLYEKPAAVPILSPKPPPSIDLPKHPWTSIHNLWKVSNTSFTAIRFKKDPEMATLSKIPKDKGGYYTETEIDRMLASEDEVFQSDAEEEDKGTGAESLAMQDLGQRNYYSPERMDMSESIEHISKMQTSQRADMPKRNQKDHVRFYLPSVSRQTPAGEKREQTGKKKLNGNATSFIPAPTLPYYQLETPNWRARISRGDVDIMVPKGHGFSNTDLVAADKHGEWILATVKSIKARTLASKVVEPMLRQLYGLYIQYMTDEWTTEIVSEFVEFIYPHDMKELQNQATPVDCPVCCCEHSADLEDASGRWFSCEPRVANMPHYLPCLLEGWQEKTEGIMVGLCHFRRQPDPLKAKLSNLSATAAEKTDFNLPAGVQSDHEVVKAQGLYQLLDKRVKFLDAYPGKPMYVEYCKLGRKDSQNTHAEAWEFMYIVHCIQLQTHVPVIVLLIPPCPSHGMNEMAYMEMKREWAEEGRKLSIMARALGVGFCPIWTNVFRAEQALVGKCSYRAEPLFGANGSTTREYTRRITESLFGLHKKMQDKLLTKEDWQYLDALPML
jgi:hypothetical protein